MDKGWECPRCQRVWAPKVTSCYACNNRGKGKPKPPASDKPPPDQPTHMPKLLKPLKGD